MAKLEGKVAVITGGTSGMALASTKLFVEEGAYVFITGRRQEQLDKAIKEIGRNVTGVQGDAGKSGLISTACLTRLKGEGSLRHSVRECGRALAISTVPLAVTTEKLFDDTFNVNARGTFFTAQKALPLLRDGGSIILNTSIANILGQPGASVYSASKAAVRSFARTWTSELKDRKIRVNAVSPGAIGDTGSFEHIPAEMKSYLISQTPVGRLGLSREIAATVLFLASDDSSFITGSEIAVDGGMTQV